MASKITLEVAEGPIRGKIFVFEEQETFIFGRARDCHARLSQDDTTASRHHFLLEVNPPDIRIRDLGSLNGTYINGKKFGGRREGESPQDAANRKLPDLDLSDRDQISVGETVFVVRIQSPAFCCRCHKEIPEEFQAMCRWIEGTYLCPQCRAEVEDAKPQSPQPEVIPETKTDAINELVHLLLHERADSQEEAALTNIAGYRIERMIGRGSLGGVYLAQRKDDSVKVALTIILAKTGVDEKSRQRFHQEIETLGELRHSNIVDLYEHGSAERGFYFGMEYCAGGSAEHWMEKKGGKLPLEEAGWIVLQVLQGLSFAHQKGYVHRSIRPSNILLTGQSKYTAKLADFGLARSLDRSGFFGINPADTSMSCARFLPREQLTQFRLSNPVSDVWSLAASLYYMVTGQSPRYFRSDRDPLEIVLRGEVIPIRDYAPNIPKKVAKVIDKALSDDLRDRYKDASEFLRALNKVL